MFTFCPEGENRKGEKVLLESTLTCPSCGHQANERMPTDACQFFYLCKGCGTKLKALPGDCCVSLLRFGALSAEAIGRLLWIDDVRR